MITIRTLFGGALGACNFNGFGDRALIGAILTIASVFFSNVILLNYLIAILTTTYTNM